MALCVRPPPQTGTGAILPAQQRGQIPKPFSIHHVLASTHSRMEYCDAAEMISYVNFVLGFRPSNNLETFVQQARELDAFVQSNAALLSEVTVTPKPEFVAGTDWDHEFFLEEQVPESYTYTYSEVGAAAAASFGGESDSDEE